ncbi:hypothetical protein V1512DRAFT_281886 [Lipomyces arxii]|uniref:uncharacterized protein n=1 Tax=Lipomyces arxii TaxID=56418 RepID=UPI0034CD1D4F
MQTLNNAFEPVIPATAMAQHYDQYDSKQQRQQNQQDQQNQQQVVPNICFCPQVARVPRPRNAFILYRQHHHATVVAEHPGKTNPEISKIIGEQWRQLSAEEKAVWQRLGDEEKKSHLQRFPDYRYQPRRSIKRNSDDSSNGSAQHTNYSSLNSSNLVQVCSKCHGHTTNGRGVFLSKPPVESSSPSPPPVMPITPSSGSQQQSVPQVAPIMDARYDRTYIPDVNFTPILSNLGQHQLPPIRPHPQDDMPQRLSCDMRSRSIDDDRTGVEALLSLTSGTSICTPSPEQNKAHLGLNPISSIMNLEQSVDEENGARKRRCLPFHENSPVSQHGDSDSDSQVIGPTVTRSSRTQSASSADGKFEELMRTPTYAYWLSLPMGQKFEILGSIWRPLSRDGPRGAVIAIECLSGPTDSIVSEIVKRIDQLAVCRNALPDVSDLGDGASLESKIIKSAFHLHETLASVHTFVNSGKSVLLDHYVVSMINEGTRLLSEYNKNADSIPRTVAMNWNWCLNLFRGTIAPDLTIYARPDSNQPSAIMAPDGCTRVVEVSGLDNIELIDQEVRKVMNNLRE